MNSMQSVKDVQMKILEVMKFIDEICRENGIVYYIMGGTALGAVRHGGFIPWDDDLDIFMTPDQYAKFRDVFDRRSQNLFVIQEWRTTPDYLEYAKVRMNGTTFIEDAFIDRLDLHQGIYVDIMMLHKVPNNRIVQKKVYFESKYVTLYGLSQRRWKPKSFIQKIALFVMKVLPNKYLLKKAYKDIYQYDNRQDNYMFCYWITPAKFKNGLFDPSFFSGTPVDIKFEDTYLLASSSIREYLSYRYGDYMKIPSVDQQKAAVHAKIYDVNTDYHVYIDKDN